MAQKPQRFGFKEGLASTFKDAQQAALVQTMRDLAEAPDRERARQLRETAEQRATAAEGRAVKDQQAQDAKAPIELDSAKTELALKQRRLEQRKILDSFHNDPEYKDAVHAVNVRINSMPQYKYAEPTEDEQIDMIRRQVAVTQAAKTPAPKDPASRGPAADASGEIEQTGMLEGKKVTAVYDKNTGKFLRYK